MSKTRELWTDERRRAHVLNKLNLELASLRAQEAPLVLRARVQREIDRIEAAYLRKAH